MPVDASAGPAAGEGSPGGRSWDRVLISGLVAAVVGGLLLVAAPDFIGLSWLNDAVAGAFFDGVEPTGAGDLRRWLYAVEGATLAAFGLLGLAVARTAFRRRERWARNALALSVLVWYPLDTAASLLYGVWENAVLNTAIALVLLVPVAATWGRFSVAAPGRGDGPGGDR